MKRLLTTLALAATTFGAFAQNTLHIEGSNEMIGDSVYVITRATFRNPLGVAVKDGKFSVDMPLSEVQTVYVMGKPKTPNDRVVRFTLLGVPGEKAVYSAEGTHFYITGSQFYKEFDTIDRATEKMEKLEDARDYVVNYAKEHPTSEAPVAMLASLGYEAAQDIEKALTPEVRNGRMKAYIDNVMAGLQKQHEEDLAAAKKQGAGVVAPAFTLKDINGKDLSLASLKGKYVVLDFWGSWCIWCIRGIPKMKEYYNKYKGKFEILGIDCNDTPEKWKAAVEKHQLPWLHVYNPRDSKVLNDYGIQGFPTKILLDPEGKIVKTVVGEDPSFYTLLDETFGK